MRGSATILPPWLTRRYRIDRLKGGGGGSCAGGGGGGGEDVSALRSAHQAETDKSKIFQEK